MLTEKDFPRWVFRSRETRLAESMEDYDEALQNGWFGTIGETTADKTKAIVSEVPLTSPDAHEADADEDTAPTRAELEAKATELGIEFHPNIGDKKLADRIDAALSTEV